MTIFGGMPLIEIVQLFGTAFLSFICAALFRDTMENDLHNREWLDRPAFWIGMVLYFSIANFGLWLNVPEGETHYTDYFVAPVVDWIVKHQPFQ